MGRWLFTTMLAGEFFSVNEYGEKQQHIGLPLYLGVETGDTPEEAFSRIYGKHSLHQMPSLANAPIHAFELAGKSVTLDYGKSKKIAGHDATEEALTGYVANGSECEWCHEEIPSNGAARYSHLKKHVRQLVKKSLLTEEQGQAIRSVELAPEMRAIFEGEFKK